jgi:hypothetical protein
MSGIARQEEKCKKSGNMNGMVTQEDQQREEQPKEEWKCEEQYCIKVIQEE